MFGKIKNINDSTAAVYINKGAGVIPNLMNLYVVFEAENVSILGEVKEVDEELVYIDLKGEFLVGGILPRGVHETVYSSTFLFKWDFFSPKRIFESIQLKNEQDIVRYVSGLY